MIYPPAHAARNWNLTPISCLQFYRLGVDGVFSDFTDTALAARDAYLREMDD